MAIEFLSDGSVNIENRLAVFENGYPVNQKYWDSFKGMMESIAFTEVEITKDSIERVFNQIIDPFTNMTYKSETHQFYNYCKANGFMYRTSWDHPYSVFVRRIK